MTGLPPESYRGSPGPQAAATTFANPSPDFVSFLTGNPGGLAGPVVNEHTALKYAALYSCVTLIAGTIAALPLITYRRTGRGRVRAADRPEYRLLHDEFNPDTAAPVGREATVGHLLTWGNGYTQIVFNKSGSAAVELRNLCPDLVCPYRDKGRGLRYEVYERGNPDPVADLPGAEVIHVPALGYDGLVGYSPVRMAAAVIRAGMAQDLEAEKFVTRGIRPPGAITFRDGVKFPDQQAATRWRDTFRAAHATTDSTLNALVLEDGAKWVQLGIDPESAQLLESRQFSRAEVCGLYHVPPHMIGDTDKSSSWGAGIAEQVAGFIKFALLPWVNKIEKEKTRKLFRGNPDLFCEHMMDGLERADIEKRTAAITKQIEWGMLSPNEGRAIENKNPYDGGDVWFYPLNFGRVDEDGNDIAPPAAAMPGGAPQTPAEPPEPEDDGGGDDDAAARVGRAWLAATCRRLLAREANALAGLAEKPQTFLKRAGAFYDSHLKTAEAEYAEVAGAWMVCGLPEKTAAAHVERSRDELLAVCAANPADLAAAVKDLTDGWLVSRPAEVSRAGV